MSEAPQILFDPPPDERSPEEARLAAAVCQALGFTPIGVALAVPASGAFRQVHVVLAVWPWQFLRVARRKKRIEQAVRDLIEPDALVTVRRAPLRIALAMFSLSLGRNARTVP